MRRMIVAVAVAAALTALVGTTAHALEGLKFGGRFGININRMTGSTSANDLDDGKFGIQLGATVDFDLPVTGLTFRTGLVYTQKGGWGKSMGTWVMADLDYIEIPALVKYAVGDGAYVIGGLNLGFNMKAELKTGFLTVDEKDDTEDVELSLSMGGGYSFPLGAGSLDVDIIWSPGLSDVYTGTSVARTSTLCIGATYIF